MDTKKEKPSRHGGITFASIVAILTGITSLLIFLTGKTSLPAIISAETATETPTVAPTPTVTLTAPALTLTPALTPTPAAVVSPTLVPLTAQPPSDSDLETVPSIWTLTKFRELTAPGSNGYTVEVTHSSIWLWDCYFCATHDAFQEFLSTLKVEFWINGVPLPESSIRVFDRKGITGWMCRDWATMVSGWPPDRSLFLEIRYTHSKPASDGKAEFAAGEYSQTIVVVVKG